MDTRMKEAITTRVFFGIPIPEAIILPLRKKIISSIQDIDNKVRWMDPNNYHITVRFLGNATEQQVKKIIEATKDFLPNLVAFDVSLQWMGLFPPTKKTRLFAVQLSPPQALSFLYNQLNILAAEQGFPEEKRPYLPHITLFKIVRSLPKPLQIDPIPINKVSCHIGEVVLYESRPSNLGSCYIPLQVFQLDKRDP